MPFSVLSALPRRVPRLVGHALDALTGLRTLQRIYDASGPFTPSTFPTDALATLGIGVTCDAAHLAERLPLSGPVLVVANHPHGAFDGLALAHALRAVRDDVRLLGNQLLARIPEMRDHIVPIHSFAPAASRNASGVRAALDWLRDGHVLVVFPAGEVSHVRAADGRIVDGPWRDGAARLAARSGAPVLPIFIEGNNSQVFLHAGRVTPWLRSALLARELLRLRGRTVRVTVGRAVSARRLSALGEPAAQTAYLRVRTYDLAPDAGERGALVRHARRRRPPLPVAALVPAAALAAEIEALPLDTRLVEQGDWRVHLVGASDAPLAVQEIATLREVTFRAAGEGTGRPRDLDRFDRHYRHLFVWHRAHRCIAGAYRIAATDDVLTRQGLGGLYTRTLFRYPAALLRDLGPSLELGRSFVRVEYQRDYQPLLLLWRGIGALVASSPRYRTLFGPVSISAEYGPTTRQLLAKLLLAGRGSLLQSFVVPRRPLPDDRTDGTDALVRGRVASNVHEIDAIVRELEAGRRGLPVLLRHYLRLNARLLGFSVDPAFGGVLDGLIVVDLLDVDPRLLERYLGADAARTMLAAHGRGANRAHPPREPVTAPA